MHGHPVFSSDITIEIVAHGRLFIAIISVAGDGHCTG